jgi:16S rRNA G966 N2-methylase RsmD
MKYGLLSYYGSKARLAPKYPVPRYDTIIEPFAGAAGYSLKHYTATKVRIILVEKDPKVYGALSWLHAATPEEVRTLPLLKPDQTVDTLHICQEAKWLIGFWVNNGVASPCKQLSQWAKTITNPINFWSTKCRERLAITSDLIKPWTLIHGDYTEAPDLEATWFIDPPYQRAGKHYSTNTIDYTTLAEWCRSRRGQVIVCENAGAAWLPFTPLCNQVGARKAGNGRKSSTEVMWTNGI